MEAIRDVLFNSPIKISNPVKTSAYPSQRSQSSTNHEVTKHPSSKIVKTNKLIKKSVDDMESVYPGVNQSVLRHGLLFNERQSEIHPGLKPRSNFNESGSDIHPGLRPIPSYDLAKGVAVPSSSKPTMAVSKPIVTVPVSKPTLTATVSKPTGSKGEEIQTKPILLKKATVPSLYSLKQLALKKKKISENPLEAQNGELFRPKFASLHRQRGPDDPLRFKAEEKLKVYSNAKSKPSFVSAQKYQEKGGSSPSPQFNLQEKSTFEANGTRKPLQKTTVTLEDDDSDIEVEEINILPKQVINSLPTQVNNYLPSQRINSVPKQVVNSLPKQVVNSLPKQVVNSVPKQVVNSLPLQAGMGAPQSDQVISVIMKQVEELETTLKTNLANKESELQIERQIVGQLKKKNQILELRDKKRKEALEKKDSEYTKELEKKNNEIETLRSVTTSMSQKLIQKNEEMESVRSISKKNSDFLSKKLVQKQIEEQTVVNERDSLKNLVQGYLAKELVYKQRIESLDIKIVEKDQLAKDLKIKVNKLIGEFTKEFKDKHEELQNKIQEVEQSSSEISRLKSIISDKNREIQSKEFMVENQTTVINGLKKLNDENHIKTKQLQRKLSKLKTLKSNGTVISDVDLFEDKLEQFVYDFYGKRKQEKPLMLTYLWPVFRVHVDPCFLKKTKQESKPEVIWEVKTHRKPQMITYFWPVLPFQPKAKLEIIPCRGVKRKISLISPSGEMKIELSLGKKQKLCASFVDNISIPKTIEQINISDDMSEFVSTANNNWPVVSFNQATNQKRKFEDILKKEVKRLKLDTESKDVVASILTDAIEFSVSLVMNLVPDIIAGIVEKSSTVKTENWPVVLYRSSSPIISNDSFKVCLGKYVKERSKLENYKKQLSAHDILKITQSPALHLFPFRGIDSMKDRHGYRNLVNTNNWPVIIYKKNLFGFDVQKDVAESNLIISQENNLPNGSLSSLELTLNEALSNCKKRKIEDGLKMTPSKKVKLHVHEDIVDKVIEEMLDDVMDFHWQRTIKLLVHYSTM